MSQETDERYVAIRGTETNLMPGTRMIGPSDPGQKIEVTLVLRRRSSAPAIPKPEDIGAQLPRDRQYITRESFGAVYGAEHDHVVKVEDFARASGLTVLRSSSAKRTITLAGSRADVSAAFRVNVMELSDKYGSYLGYKTPIRVPVELASIVTSVFGLEDRVLACPQVRSLAHEDVVRMGPLPALQIYTGPQVAELYNFPNASGQGECNGIIEFGGGYDLTDVMGYFQNLGLAVKPNSISYVSLGGVTNKPGLSAFLDTEVYLDVEVAGSVASQARLTVYFAPPTTNGFVDAFSTAIHDPVNKPSVIFCTWGAFELLWQGMPSAMAELEVYFQEAAALGVTIVVASGDSGATAGVHNDGPHLYYPGSSPNVLSIGGTSLFSSAGSVVRESTWNRLLTGGGASTGGFSRVFQLPPYQRGPNRAVSTVGRGVPDACADADPFTGYLIRVYWYHAVIAGTSAAAPLWAALIARINELLGVPVGYFNPLIYGKLASGGVFNDVTLGNNGLFAAGPGWDACTGWGSPDGVKLLQALGGTRAANKDN